MLEQDIPLLKTDVPNSLFGRRINTNTDILVNITYPKPPDEAYYSLIVFYNFEQVSQIQYAYTNFTFKIWDSFDQI